jgi:class 3 adenylate cyclase
MPMFMDIHDVPGVTPEDVAKAHLEDVKVQAKHHVEYVKYCIGKALPFQDLGQISLKGFDQPVHVHCVAATSKSN